jgi:hypothetical protein
MTTLFEGSVTLRVLPETAHSLGNYTLLRDVDELSRRRER